MKKTFILISMLFILSGCDATYTLNISDKTIKEELYINSTKKAEWETETINYKEAIDIASKGNIPALYENYKPGIYYKIKGLDYYNIKKVSTGENLGVKYNYSFNYNDYKNSTLANYHSLNFEGEYENNILNIKMGNKTDIYSNNPLLENITLKVISKYKVIYNNADEIEGNEFYWYLNKDNINKKNPSIKIDTNQKFIKMITPEKDNNNFIYIVVGIIIIFALIAGIYITIKVKNSNK